VTRTSALWLDAKLTLLANRAEKLMVKWIALIFGAGAVRALDGR